MTDKDFKLNIFPWDGDTKPYFINDEGVEWWIDKETTKWARRKDSINNTKPLDAVCFYVRKNGEYLGRVLVDNQQNILHFDQSLEGMAYKIDMLRFLNQSK